MHGERAGLDAGRRARFDRSMEDKIRARKLHSGSAGREESGNYGEIAVSKERTRQSLFNLYSLSEWSSFQEEYFGSQRVPSVDM